MKILITGVHGFVGSNLVRNLHCEHEIYGLDIVTPFKAGVVQTLLWDDLDKVPEVDALIHLAGMAHDTKNQTQTEVYFKVNTGLTERIYDWFLKSSAKKFIFFSSVKAAADSVEVSPLTEDIVPKPVGPYGESKIKAEDYIQKRWSAPGKTTVILRPCMIHGPGNKGNLNLLYSVVKKGIPWPLGSFDNLRSFTSIGNLQEVISRILATNIPTGIYNMGDDRPLSTNELIRLIGEVTGKRNSIWHLPKGIVSGMAKIGTVLHLPLNNERLRKLTENYIVDNSKIKSAIGIAEMPVDAADGIRETIKSFQ